MVAAFQRRDAFGAVYRSLRIDTQAPSVYAQGMEVRLEPELARKVVRWSAETGQPVNDLIEGAITGYFSEVEQIRETLDRRYDEILSGKVQGVDGPEAVRLIRERAAARRKSIA
jgi:hypothetical protein